MGDHPYLCDCNHCEYERTLERVRAMQDKYREEKTQRFREAYSGEDPFPPRTSTGRFKTQAPYTQQKPRQLSQGKYRRYQDKALDVINFQYQPWPGHEWVTYFTVTFEQLTTVNPHFAKQQYNRNADKALQEKRFYKIERVDQTS